MCNLEKIMNTLLYWMIVMSISIPAWGLMQECPPADTIAVNPAQNNWNIPTENQWDEIEVMTWNIEWFPKNGEITVDYVTQIIDALDMDILAIQEVDNTSLFTQMLDDLTEYEGYFESSWFAGLAYIYKTETIEINDIYEIYTTSPYWSPFPRSPMVMDMNFMGENYIIINNHFKCCGDGILDFNNESDEEKRRYNANNLLKKYIETFLLDENVMVLGDLNDDIAEAPQNNVFQMFFDNSHFFNFVKQCRKAGIGVPIIPGLKILASVKHLSSIPKNFYVDLPNNLVDEVNENPKHVKEIGLQWGNKQCEDLLNNGVLSIHFYIMNNAAPILKIVDGFNK